MPGPMSPLELAAYQLLRFLNPHESYCALYLLGAVVFAAAVALWRRRGRGRLRWRTLARLLGSRRLWTHRSTRLDVKLYLLHGALIIGVYGLFEATGEAWRTAARHAVLATGAGGWTAPGWAVGAVTTVMQLLALELGYWALHYAFHKVPALWELHKVHHSAEVMTPLSEWRQHPIEFIAFANVFTAAIGAPYGAMQALFGEAAHPFTLFAVNLLFVLHFATFHHLRHSGVWIAATGWLGRVVHSPAHHQIHHSTDPRHFDRNLGYALSVFDWMFATLHVPERRGRVRLGVDGEPAYRGVMDTLVRPFAANGARIAAYAGARARRTTRPSSAAASTEPPAATSSA